MPNIVHLHCRCQNTSFGPPANLFLAGIAFAVLILAQVVSTPTTAAAQGGADLNQANESETFPVQEQFEPIDIGHYRATYPDVFQSWMPDNKEQAAAARSWGSYLGPLGIRIRSHVPQFQSRPAFAAIVPASIRTEDGDLGLAAAEVVQIAPGSPAEHHLQIGDLIIGIEDEELKSGNDYRPDWTFMHKDRRELQLMLGEKIDQAQGRGEIRLTVLRYTPDTHEKYSQELTLATGRVSTEKIPVEPGDEVHLIVNQKENDTEDHLAWLSPQLIGDAGTLDLSDFEKNRPTHTETGWGDIRYGSDVDGNDLEEDGIGVHADSKMVYTVAPGYQFFQTSLKVTKPKGDLNAKVLVVKPLKPLPVRRQELWAGKGGNQSLDTQSFEVEVPGDGLITLRTDEFDGGNGGDGAVWLDIVLEGEFGKKKLLDLPADSAWAGWGSPKIVTDQPYSLKGTKFGQVLHLHATGEATWRLPPGTKKIAGSFAGTNYGPVQPKVLYTNLARPLTGIHQQNTVQLRFPIGKTGSFSDTYPNNCPKSELTARRQTAWLAAQQRDDGSWPRLAGYTGDGWDTSWCALALMSSGDSQYEEQIRNAAYRIAYHDAPSEWTAERAMRLIFLSEYFLRTKDDSILAGVQAAYRQLESCCKTDFMAGHKVNGFGYGIAGQHYGTGHLALAFALASRTPITIDNTLVEGVIGHAGEVCVNGTYAYGRGRREARNDQRQHGGGNAMLGPGILGSQIGGGNQSSIDEAMQRFEASIGDGDNSHATSSLAFIFSSLAMAAGDEFVFQKHMQNFKYKMTIDDNWEGGFLKSGFALDLQTGEGVTANWIRTAGSILVLNALKHNLAITGKKEFFNSQRMQTPAVSEWGGQVHSYYLRNWCLAQELLGEHAPTGLAAGIAELNSLPRTMELVPKTKALVIQQAPALIAHIASDNGLTDRDRAYAIELICGLDFKIYATVDDQNLEKVELHINQPLHQLNWLDEDKGEIWKTSPFKLKAKVEITADNLAEPFLFEVQDLEGFNLDEGTRKWQASTALKGNTDQTFRGTANIAFKIGDTLIRYQRPLLFNVDISQSNNTNLRRLQLRLKMAPRAIFQSQPLMIAGLAFDCMYPVERMVAVKHPATGKKKITGIINIHEGDEVIVDLASENFICAWVHRLEFEKMSQVTIFEPKEYRNVRGTIEGDLKNLVDYDYETWCELKTDDQDGNRKNVTEFDFGKEVTLNGLDANYQHSCFLRVWYHDGTHWIPIAWDNYSPNTSHNPTFPDTGAQRWRVEIQHGAGKRFHTLRFYHNPNRIVPQPPLPQMKEQKYLPPIQPD